MGDRIGQLNSRIWEKGFPSLDLWKRRISQATKAWSCNFKCEDAGKIIQAKQTLAAGQICQKHVTYLTRVWLHDAKAKSQNKRVKQLCIRPGITVTLCDFWHVEKQKSVTAETVATNFTNDIFKARSCIQYNHIQ